MKSEAENRLLELLAKPFLSHDEVREEELVRQKFVE